MAITQNKYSNNDKILHTCMFKALEVCSFSEYANNGANAELDNPLYRIHCKKMNDITERC